jgi:hypothetical protein
MIILSGCVPPDAAPAAKSSSSGTTTVGTVDDSVGFSVTGCATYEGGASSGTCSSGNYITHKRTNTTTDPYTDYNKTCSVDPSVLGTSSALIDCMVETDELEFVFKGLSLAYNVPSTMCEYFRVRPYSFWNYQPGFDSTTNGATAVSYTLDLTGKITGSVTATPAGTAVVNSDNTGVRCKYDYSQDSDPGPNCCEGTYSLTVTQQVDSDGNGVPDSTTVTSSSPKWTGKKSACLSGPAMATQQKSASGWPLNDLYFVSGKGINKAYVASNNGFYNSLAGANFYKPSPATVPVALSKWASFTPSLTYDFECLDRDDEILARIRVTVREWNKKAELDKYRVGTSGADPDTSGSESNGSGDDYEDREDWNSVASSNTTFPSHVELIGGVGGGASTMTNGLF